MGALGLVQVQGAGDAFQHAVGRAGRPAAFQPGVVVDADPGQERDLFPAQPGHPAVAAVGGQPGLLGGDPGAAGDQEVAHLVPVVHNPRLRPRRTAWEGLSVPGTPDQERHARRGGADDAADDPRPVTVVLAW